MVELVAPGPVDPFHAAVELGRARRQGVERDLQIPASGLEFGHECGPAIDLDGPSGEWCLNQDKRPSGSAEAGGAAIVLAGDGVGGELW
ncbi:hypothetical protein [Acidithiobacillus sp.]